MGKARPKQSSADQPRPRKAWPPGTEDLIAREMVLTKMRDAADMVKTWEACGRPACLKARRCRDAEVRCFDELREPIQGAIQELADWPRFEGPYDESFYATLAADVRKAMDRGDL